MPNCSISKPGMGCGRCARAGSTTATGRHGEAPSGHGPVPPRDERDRGRHDLTGATVDDRCQNGRVDLLDLESALRGGWKGILATDLQKSGTVQGSPAIYPEMYRSYTDHIRIRGSLNCRPAVDVLGLADQIASSDANIRRGVLDEA